MARKEIPLVSGWRQPDVKGLIYNFCENMYPVSYQGNGFDTKAMLPAPGNQRFYKLIQSIPTNKQAIRGMIVMNGFIFLVVDVYLVKLTPLFANRVLTGFAETVYEGITSGTTPVRMAYGIVGRNPTQYELGIVDGHYVYSYTTVDDTLINASTALGASTLPFHAVDIAYLSNRFLITMDYSSTFFASTDVASGGRKLNQSSYVFGSMNQADDLQGIAINNGNFTLFGRLHAQTWTDAGLAALPFRPITGQTYNYGASSTYTIDTAVDAQGNDITVFLSQDKHGSLSCVVLGRGGAQPISNELVEGFWAANVTNPFDAIGFFYRDRDDLFYQLTFPTDNLTFVYDFERNEWHRRKWTDRGRHKANAFVHYNDSRFNGGLNLFGDFESTWLYKYSSDFYVYEDSKTTVYQKGSQLNGETLNQDETADNTNVAALATNTYFTGIDIPKVCVTPLFALPDDKTITISMAEVEYISGEGRGDENVDIYTEDSDPIIKLRVSRDRGRTYGEPIDGAIGRQGDYSKRIIYYGLGSSHDGFVFKLQSYAKQPIIILKMTIEFQVGEN